MDHNGSNYLKSLNQNQITIPCLVLCAVIALIIGFLPILPSGITLLFRPAFIFICLLIPRAFHYSMTKAGKALIAYLLYLGAIYFAHDLTHSAFMNYVAMVLFGVFFIFATLRIWSKREIRLLIHVLILATAFCAVVVLIDNEDIRQMNIVGDVSFLGRTRNRNAIGYSMVPGALCCVLIMLHDPKTRWHARLLPYLACFLVVGFTIIGTAARSASLAFLIGSFLIVWESAHNSRSLRGQLGAQVLIIGLSALAIYLLVNYTSDTTSARVFENLDDKSGREELWGFAWELIHARPWFGGGFDYWDNMGGSSLYTHNTYLMIMVISGYVGAGFLTLFLGSALLELISCRNYIPLAFFVELALHVYSETGLDYYAYIPLTFAYIIYQYLRNQNPKIGTVFESTRPARRKIG